MSNTINFNSVDLSGASYGLTLMEKRIEGIEMISSGYSIPGFDGQYAGESRAGAKIITVEATVIGTSESNLQSKLDYVKGALVTRTPAALKFSTITDRYWLAKLKNFDVKKFCGNCQAELDLDFLCSDPHAYSNSANQVNGSDNNPASCPNDGGADSFPIITMTADTTIAVDITITHTQGSTVLTYSGGMTSGQVLVINSKYQTVTKQSVSDMANVDGDFPILQGGTNGLTFTGFSGSYSISYYDRFL